MMKLFFTSMLMLSLACGGINTIAQKKKLLVDVAHGQKFYSDPADKISSEFVPTLRLEYMTGELTKNASSHGAEIAYLKTSITKEILSKVDLLFIHIPSVKYS